MQEQEPEYTVRVRARACAWRLPLFAKGCSSSVPRSGVRGRLMQEQDFSFFLFPPSVSSCMHKKKKSVQ
jgi:hypothetical protein